jgi:hypothetical protein
VSQRQDQHGGSRPMIPKASVDLYALSIVALFPRTRRAPIPDPGGDRDLPGAGTHRITPSWEALEAAIPRSNRPVDSSSRPGSNAPLVSHRRTHIMQTLCTGLWHWHLVPD